MGCSFRVLMGNLGFDYLVNIEKFYCYLNYLIFYYFDLWYVCKEYKGIKL